MILPKPLPKIIKVKLDLKDSGGYAGPIEYLLRQQLLIQSEKLADDHGDHGEHGHGDSHDHGHGGHH